ncbi:ABC transporter ATP-binding protein [Phytoactinopolyspora limicola]|uniref:ABC transporter ATP-binding protein n=1 Tax=Phytoactinopolyspora limicola TaxID=2715536 RepID=UPI0014094958|nr:ATP-binding cassette domain-containing protein [Phytoactinopolyspora limicola]
MTVLSPGAIVAKDLVKKHGRRFQLGPLSLHLEPGVTCLVGANGAGKSTLFRVVAGIDRPSSGSLRLEGPGSQLLGYLPEELDLPRAATCEEFLHYVAWLHRVPRKDRDAAVTSVLEQTRLLDRRQSKIRELSKGMRQRLGIAHALVHNPPVVLLDEPSGGLDPRQRAVLRETIVGNAQNRVVLVSTHLVEDVRGLGGRVIVIRNGSLVFDGSVVELERCDVASAPGETPLERAVSGLIGESE